MERFSGGMGWLLTTLGVFLLACSILLVPSQPLLAQTTGKPCKSVSVCDNGCSNSAMCNLANSCLPAGNCTCSQVANPTDCAGCICDWFFGCGCS
jgi:hypothetical protein